MDLALETKRSGRVAIELATLPARACAPDEQALAAVLGGRGWWRRVWRRFASARATLNRTAAALVSEVRRIRLKMLSQQAAFEQHCVFHAFWQVLRF